MVAAPRVCTYTKIYHILSEQETGSQAFTMSTIIGLDGSGTRVMDLQSTGLRRLAIRFEVIVTSY